MTKGIDHPDFVHRGDTPYVIDGMPEATCSEDEIAIRPGRSAQASAVGRAGRALRCGTVLSRSVVGVSTPHPFNQGSQAFIDGKMDTDNPFSADSSDHEAWQHGWQTEADNLDDWLESQP